MKHKTILALFTLSLILTLAPLATHESFAQSSSLMIEAEQHWETYGVGGTCISGGHNLFVADVDGDGVMEIITGGSTYDIVNGTRTNSAAPLKIWNWDSQNLTLEKSYKWVDSRIRCVYAGDADGDGIIELITAGGVTNSTGDYAQLRIWNWNGETLFLKASYEGADTKGTSIRSAFVSDVDRDGAPEIITVGQFSSSNQSSAQLRIWHWDGDNLTLQKSVEWRAMKEAIANSVYAYDLDNDGSVEIITGGYDNDLKNSSGQLRIWRWNGEDLSLKANEEWRLVEGVYGLTIAGGIQGNTIVNNVKVGDVDEDGAPEIVTGGFAYDGEKVDAQLRIWNWNGQSLTLEKSQEWTTEYLTEVKSISLNDVDGDGRKDIVTSGIASSQGSFAANATTPELAQLRVWSWDGTSLTLKQSQDWYIDEGACGWNIATGDMDKDGVIEIVTVGCTYLSNMCDPDMRIWSIARESASPLYVFSAIIGIVAATLVVISFLFVRKRRQ